jgi:hypothetical protein
MTTTQQIDWTAPASASAYDFENWLRKYIAAHVQLRRNKDGDYEPMRGCSLTHTLAVDLTDAEELAQRGEFDMELRVELASDDDDCRTFTVRYQRDWTAECVGGRWIHSYEVEVDCG